MLPELKVVPKKPLLWILASKLEEADGKSIKARALREDSSHQLGNEWAEYIGVEEPSEVQPKLKPCLCMRCNVVSN